MLKRLFLFSIFLIVPLNSYAQVAPSASGASPSLWAGAEYSNFNSDFGARLNGVNAVVDFNLRPRWGAEGVARWLRFDEPGGMHQDNYLIGPRYRFYRHDKFSFYAKFLMGGGFMTYPSNIGGSGSYFAYSPGGTAEYRLSRRLSARVDYDYEFWPSAPGIPGFRNHGLTPNGFSGGVTYKIF